MSEKISPIKFRRLLRFWPTENICIQVGWSYHDTWSLQMLLKMDDPFNTAIICRFWKKMDTVDLIFFVISFYPTFSCKVCLFVKKIRYKFPMNMSMWPHISYSEPNFLLVSPQDSPLPSSITPRYQRQSTPSQSSSITLSRRGYRYLLFSCNAKRYFYDCTIGFSSVSLVGDSLVQKLIEPWKFLSKSVLLLKYFFSTLFTRPPISSTTAFSTWASWGRPPSCGHLSKGKTLSFALIFQTSISIISISVL